MSVEAMAAYRAAVQARAKDMDDVAQAYEPMVRQFFEAMTKEEREQIFDEGAKEKPRHLHESPMYAIILSKEEPDLLFLELNCEKEVHVFSLPESEIQPFATSLTRGQALMQQVKKKKGLPV